MSGVRSITVVGGNLYSLAAQYLGDATQWTVLAQMNGLTDPFLSGVQTIRLPTGTTETGYAPGPARSGTQAGGAFPGTASPVVAPPSGTATGSASGGTGMRSITVAGGNLYQIAEQYMGDATQWTTLARINGLSDPFITGAQTLRVPAPAVPTGYTAGPLSTESTGGFGVAAASASTVISGGTLAVPAAGLVYSNGTILAPATIGAGLTLSTGGTLAATGTSSSASVLGNGIVSNNRGLLIGRTFVNSNWIQWTNPDGTAGNPVANLAALPGIIGSATIDVTQLGDQVIPIAQPINSFLLEAVLYWNGNVPGSSGSTGAIFTAPSGGGQQLTQSSAFTTCATNSNFMEQTLTVYPLANVLSTPQLYYHCTHGGLNLGYTVTVVLLGRPLA